MSADVLGVSCVGLDQNFYALGGDSLAVAMLAELIESELGVEVPASVLLDITTARALAAQVSAKDDSSAELLVAIRRTGSKSPLFAIHHLFGHAFFAKRLASYLGDDQPLYALCAPSGRREGFRPASLEELARHYVAEVRGVQRHGPYNLYGHCLGGVIAFEMAIQLGELGEGVGLLAVGDSMAPGLVASVDVSAFAFARVEPPPRYTSRVVQKIAALRAMKTRLAAAELLELSRREFGRAAPMIRWRLSAAERQRRRWEGRERQRLYPWTQRVAALCTAYQPKRQFDGPVLLIRTDDDMGLPYEEYRGWARDVRGAVREVCVSCGHDQIDAGPFLSEVAKAIRPALDNVAI